MKTIAIIVNFKGLNDTVECVKSLLVQSFSSFKIIIVDNNSPTNDYVQLKEIFTNTPEVEIIKSHYNGGFSYGNNVDINYTLEHHKPVFYY